jgi:hypothetical protein
MTMPNFRTPQTWIITGLCAALLGGSAWAVFRGPRAKAGGVVIPPEMSVDSLKAGVQEPDKLRETIRDTMRRDDLTDEQRRQIAENMRTVWEGEMNKRVDEYFAAPSEEEKNAVLDRQIDEFQERMKEGEQRRKEEENKDGEKARAEQGQRFAGMMGQQSREQRKDRSESRDPDRAGRQMAYFTAMRNRATERGIKMPMGGGGFRGGPGGGPGAGPGGGGPRPDRGP